MNENLKSVLTFANFAILLGEHDAGIFFKRRSSKFEQDFEYDRKCTV